MPEAPQPADPAAAGEAVPDGVPSAAALPRADRDLPSLPRLDALPTRADGAATGAAPSLGLLGTERQRGGADSPGDAAALHDGEPAVGSDVPWPLPMAVAAAAIAAGLLARTWALRLSRR